MVFQIFLDHLVADRADSFGKIANGPEMAAPIPFSQFGKGLLDYSG